jgi:DNA-binding XRE family transcriptional regulator
MLTNENAKVELLRFRIRHRNKDMGQEKVSEKTGLSRTTISDIENGKVKPNVKTLLLLNDFINKIEGNNGRKKDQE